MWIPAERRVLVHTTGTTETIHPAEEFIISRQKDSKSTSTAYYYYFLFA